MTIQEIDEIIIFRINNTYIAWVKNDSIITLNIDNNMLEVLEEYWEDIITLFNKEEGEDILPPYQEWDYKIKLKLNICNGVAVTA